MPNVSTSSLTSLIGENPSKCDIIQSSGNGWIIKDMGSLSVLIREVLQSDIHIYNEDHPEHALKFDADLLTNAWYLQPPASWDPRFGSLSPNVADLSTYSV